MKSNATDLDTEVTLDIDEYCDDGDDDDEDDEVLENSQSSQEWEDDEIERNQFTASYMRKVVAVFDQKENGGWKAVKNRFRRVKHPYYLDRFRKYLAQNGTKMEKLKEIEDFVWEQFVNARNNALPVMDSDMRQWGSRKAKEFGFPFKASDTWLLNLKRKHRIVSRRITKFAFRGESKDEASIIEKALMFVANTRGLLEEEKERYDLLNLDQSGINYEINLKRTLSYRNEKRTVGLVRSQNASTHSYSIQPLVSSTGELVGPLLICLQEQNCKKSGEFGPIVQQRLFRPPNLHITCSKSGKLDKTIMETWVSECLAPFVCQKTYLLLDSWSGQKDEQIFCQIADQLELLCIPAGTTSIVQPLDRYFFRQFKIFIKRISNHVLLHSSAVDLKIRESVIKMISLVYNQFQSVKFRPMLRYAFCCAGYIDDVGDFNNVKDICFSFTDCECSIDECSSSAFLCCSHCESLLCFEHFFEAFHTHF